MELEGSKSLPSSFGHLTERLFAEYPIYTFQLPKLLVEKYLPNKLQPFSQTTIINFSKRHFFYSKPIIYASRCQLSERDEELSSNISFMDQLKDLLKENNSQIRYNFVLLSDYFIFVRIPRHRHISYHLLCKHITLSNRSTDVRFAGEIWKDNNGYFKFNNNSGTYKPSNQLIQQIEKLFQELIPLIQFQGMDYQTDIRLTIKHRTTNNFKQKLNIKSNQ